jgi:malate dehydrogenase
MARYSILMAESNKRLMKYKYKLKLNFARQSNDPEKILIVIASAFAKSKGVPNQTLIYFLLLLAMLDDRHMHIAQIGTGRVGRPTAYTIMCAGLADTLTLCDVKLGLAAAFAEELNHVTTSIERDVEVNSCEKDEDVAGADIILISAGKPRTPGVKMSRRDLAIQNATIVKHVSEATASKNPGAKYIVITNPVDAMAMVCKKYTKSTFVLSTGTNLESLRFRSKLAQTLAVPVSQVRGWVAGEHGDAAIPLWSTTKIFNLPVDEYAASKNQTLLKYEVMSYVKAVSRFIIDNIGGTEYGPAASFTDITRAITNNTNEILSVGTPIKFEGTPEAIFIGTPTHLGQTIGSSLYDKLLKMEQEGVKEAAKAIYQTYKTAIESMEQP